MASSGSFTVVPGQSIPTSIPTLEIKHLLGVVLVHDALRGVRSPRGTETTTDTPCGHAHAIVNSHDGPGEKIGGTSARHSVPLFLPTPQHTALFLTWQGQGSK
jgi:hypothetical protein